MSIGVTEWRRYDSSYPLADSGFDGLFADASLVLFDYETPVLQSIAVAQELLLVFQFDGVTDVTFTVPYNTAQQDACIVLRANSRYYGTIVFGPLIEYIAAGNLGAIVSVATAFNPNVIRVVNSQNGLYSLQNEYGAVAVTTTDDLDVSGGSTIRMDAISVPNKLQTLIAPAQSLYIWDATTQQMTLVGDSGNQNIIDPTATTGFGATSNVAKIDMMTTALNSSNVTTLIGVSSDLSTLNTDIYNCSVYPWQLIATVTGVKLIDVTSIGNTLYGLTTTSIVSLGTYPFTTSPTTYTLSIPGMKKIVGVFAVSGNYFVLAKAGPNDPNTSTQISDLFYKATTSGSTATCNSCGVFTVAGNFHMPPTKDLSIFTDSNNKDALLVLNGAGIYEIIVNDQYVNAAITQNYATITNTDAGLSVVPGGWSIIFAPVTPLKTINSVSPANNTIHFAGDEVITVNRTGSNEITIAVGIPDSLLSVQRSTTYA